MSDGNNDARPTCPIGYGSKGGYNLGCRCERCRMAAKWNKDAYKRISPTSRDIRLAGQRRRRRQRKASS